MNTAEKMATKVKPGKTPKAKRLLVGSVLIRCSWNWINCSGFVVIREKMSRKLRPSRV